MSDIVRVYQSTDAGAPGKGSATPLDLFNILKKCLVEGYGTTDALGWDLVGEDLANGKIAFRNNIANGGSGGVVQIESLSTATTVNSNCVAFPMQDWIDFDTHIKPGNKKSLAIYNYPTWGWWMLVGTDKAFYFFHGKHEGTVANSDRNNNPEACIFIGDYSNYIQNDTARFITFSSHNNLVNHNSQELWQSMNYNFQYDLGLAGVNAKQLLTVWSPDGGNTSDSYYVRPIFGNTDAEPGAPIHNLAQNYWPILIHNFNVGSLNAVRGALPGMLHATELMHGSESHPLFFTIKNQQYYVLRTPALAAKLYLNIEAW